MIARLVLGLAFIVPVMSCSAPKPAEQTAKHNSERENRGCSVSSLTAAKAVSAANSAISKGDYRLIAISTSGETLSTDVPGIGGHLDGSKDDNATLYVTQIGMMEFEGDTEQEIMCREVEWAYAAAYNEQIAYREPRLIVSNLIQSRACKIRRADIDYIAQYKAKPPSPTYKPLCG